MFYQCCPYIITADLVVVATFVVTSVDRDHSVHRNGRP